MSQEENEMDSLQVGIQSVQLKNKPYIISAASVVGTKEGEGPLASKFDEVGVDDKFGQSTWEAAESAMQKEALAVALSKKGMKQEQLRYLFAGDLLGQTIASSFGLMDYVTPLFAVYGACSTSGEAMSLAAMNVSAGFADLVGVVTSSHFASAEKQFRFPLAYANQRPECATWTVTGSGAFLLANEQVAAEYAKKGERRVAITGITTGKIMDYGIKDSMNMGAAMAPAAIDTILCNLQDFARKPQDYDAIVTGDLGTVGRDILIDKLKEKGYDISEQHEDCGILIFDPSQGTGAGGSGCGCSATVLAAHYIPKLLKGELKKILFVPTGALLSTVSFNEGKSVPGIAHGVVLESVE